MSYISPMRSFYYYVRMAKAQRLYAKSDIARVEAQKVRTSLRMDVVELSKSAKLYMENQARLQEHHQSSKAP
jgi:hypothetical protein